MSDVQPSHDRGTPNCAFRRAMTVADRLLDDWKADGFVDDDAANKTKVDMTFLIRALCNEGLLTDLGKPDADTERALDDLDEVVQRWVEAGVRLDDGDLRVAIDLISIKLNDAGLLVAEPEPAA